MQRRRIPPTPPPAAAAVCPAPGPPGPRRWLAPHPSHPLLPPKSLQSVAMVVIRQPAPPQVCHFLNASGSKNSNADIANNNKGTKRKLLKHHPLIPSNNHTQCLASSIISPPPLPRASASPEAPGHRSAACMPASSCLPLPAGRCVTLQLSTHTVTSVQPVRVSVYILTHN